MPMPAPVPAPVCCAAMPDHLKYAAILACAVANFAIGWAWYSPMLFMKPWLKAIGKKPSQLKTDGMAGMMAGWFVGSFLSALTIAYLMHVSHAEDTVAALRITWAGWIGLTAAAASGDYLAQRRGFPLFAINMGELLVAFSVDAVILANWH